MGKAIHFAKMIDARLMADLFRYYAGMAPEIDGVTRSVSPPEHTPKHVTIVREPVVAKITHLTSIDPCRNKDRCLAAGIP